MTQGNQDLAGVTYVDVLAHLPSCYQANNNGIAGQTSTQIAVREGGVPVTASVENNTIPSSDSVPIYFPKGEEPVTQYGPNPFPIMLNGVSGGVDYDYSRAGMTFQRLTVGPAVSSPADSPVHIWVGSQNSEFVVFWVGRNNVQNPKQILSDIAAMIASLPSSAQYLVLGVMNNTLPQDWTGASEYSTIASINQTLASTYPDHYLDIRSTLVAAYDPSNAEDVLDHAHDVPPSTLRAVDNSGTINTALDATTCNFEGVGGLNYYFTVQVDQEKILITNSDSYTVTDCVRGYGGTTAAPHAPGVSFIATDNVHLGAKGYTLVGKAIEQWIEKH